MARQHVRPLREIDNALVPPNWDPFHGCSGCDGLCKVLQDQSAVERLLRGEQIQLFSGSKDQLQRSAAHGCAFAKFLGPTSDGEPARFLRRSDQGAANKMLLLAIQTGRHAPKYGFQVAVSTIPDDPAWSIVGTSPVDPDPVSPRSLYIMDEWLRRCSSGLQEHSECVTWDARIVSLPTRVIDVSGQVPKLYTPSANESGRYATLSYCWGGPQPHATTAAKLAGYHNSLPMDSFPATIQDAITLTRALDIPYLWIDSLCIIQDSVPDKTREIATMSQVYKNSWVTFSAATASKCHDGFLGIQEETRSRLSRSVTIPIACPNGLTGNIKLSPARFNDVNMRFEDKFPIDRRAWTYQEYLLSPRVISFYHNSIEFKCQGGLFTDDGLEAEENSLNPPMFARRSKLGPLFFMQDSQIRQEQWRSDVSPEAREILRRLWDNVVLEYSTGRLTDPDDKLPAVSALASEFHRIFGD
ncbi:heterokaryon incompatibility protein-domain-containing protein, partial [Ilyonectria destructans]